MARPLLPEVTMVTTQGWKVYFKIDTDPEYQAKLLETILGQKITNRSKLEYIDLRFGERVFYR
jgi:hypothetical protein